MISFLLAQIPDMAIGFVVGAFTPAVGRMIKSLFVKETTAAKTAVETEAKKVESKL